MQPKQPHTSGKVSKLIISYQLHLKYLEILLKPSSLYKIKEKRRLTPAYLQTVAPLNRVHSDGPEYGDDLPEGVTGHLKAVHVLARGALHRRTYVHCDLHCT